MQPDPSKHILGTSPFVVRHLHKVADVVGREAGAPQESGLQIRCYTRTEYGPALLTSDELQKLSAEKKKFYQVTFIAQSYYCELCKKRVAYTRTDEEGRPNLYPLSEGITVSPFLANDDDIKLNEELNEVYGLLASLLRLEDSVDERLLLGAVRGIYVHGLQDSKDNLVILFDRRRHAIMGQGTSLRRYMMRRIEDDR
ncbi:MAG: hypothetical protein HY619_06475 [Thaumarchaeota archaeon]|nr:hypothetical protein [Nitrososphaerota archaeon]